MQDNIILRDFIAGGWIMWPILVTTLVALGVAFERLFWWTAERRKREPEKVERVYEAIQKGNLKQASELAKSSEDPVLRVIWHGLNHFHASLEGALQVSAGTEIERAGRFIVVLDTIVTLAPLLGLLGTVTGLMKAFFKLGTAEISETTISGGIAEALIATACGLSIAVVSLIFLNYFAAKVSKLQFEIQTACTNVEVLISSLSKTEQFKKLVDENNISAAA
jgi:biopolymer transport protein ExbB